MSKSKNDQNPKESSQTRWRNRILSSEMVAPSALVPNPQNWRLHPDKQQRTLDGALKEVGWIQQVIVNKRTGRIVDGHLRVSLALHHNETAIPVLYVDLTEDEERKALALIDPIVAMANGDVAAYEALTEGMTTEDVWLRELLDSTARNIDTTEVEDVVEEENEHIIPEMELHPFEHYDYITLLFRSDQDFAQACELFEIGKVKFTIPNSAKVKIGIGRIVDGMKALRKLNKD